MNRTSTEVPPYMPVFLAFVWPICIAGILSAVINSFAASVPTLNFITTTNGVIFAGIGLTTLIQGLRWYDADGIGMRRGRPMLAGLGFALLGWLGLLLARFIAIGIDNDALQPNLGITFLFLLICEAFCVQIWTFGLFFRAVADWRNPLSAVLFSGVLYGFTAFLLYGESFDSRLSILYFVIQGLFYAMIRLRTGSFLGIVIIQAIQTLTVWHLLPSTAPYSLSWLYGIACTVFLIVTWRLLPKFVSDYRV